MTEELKRLFRIKEAMAYAAVSKTKLYQERKEGHLEIKKLGGTAVIERSELDRWIDERIFVDT
jgi:excisionase family DNA binding protein